MSKTASSSVPAPSELIMQRPQHTTRLMQTQQTDTRVDTLQEQMQPEELFSEFKAKKTGQAHYTCQARRPQLWLFCCRHGHRIADSHPRG